VPHGLTTAWQRGPTARRQPRLLVDQPARQHLQRHLHLHLHLAAHLRTNPPHQPARSPDPHHRITRPGRLSRERPAARWSIAPLTWAGRRWPCWLLGAMGSKLS